MKPSIRGLLAVAAVAGLAGSVPAADATISSGSRNVFVPITPCRLFDTRPAPDNVGGRATPVGPGDTFTLQARGPQGDCNIPTTAVAISMNTTAVNGTDSSFLTVYPSDVGRPLASSLNWVARQGASPNQLNVPLAADGRISVFNFAGTIDVLGDVVGYYEDHNHDDRTTLRSISFPAESLNVFTPQVGIMKNGGIVWQYGGAAGANLDMQRPVDIVPSTPITMKLFFITGTAPAGTTVRFAARPRQYNSGDPDLDVVSSFSELLTVTGQNYHEVTIVFPAGSLTKAWWEFNIQRVDGLANPYGGPVRVVSVEIAYTGYVVARGS